ncbi:MAG: TerC family protein [Mycobacteriales bacterium]|nr:TerC family protein [Frankia sp.]
MEGRVLAYGGFVAFVLIALVVDLKVLHRNPHEVTTKEAAITSACWVALAMLFAGGVLVVSGQQKATYFVTGYLVEESLSVDNIFVFVLIFTFFSVPAAAQHRVLFYGVLGAQIFRAIFIFAGVALIARFEFVIYLFGAFLVYSGIKMLRHDGDPVDPSDNRTLRVIRRFLPLSDDYDGAKLFTRRGRVDGKPRRGRIATPLFAVLVLIEVSDLVFAVDSIPAVIGIFPHAKAVDPFIVFTSNIFAILGLRAMYFLLAGVVGTFHYLRVGLAAVLSFVGVKMLLTALHVHIPTLLSLLVIATCIGASIWASLRWPRADPEPMPDAPDSPVVSAPSK